MSRCWRGRATASRWAMPIPMSWPWPTRSRRRTPTTGWHGCWNGGGPLLARGPNRPLADDRAEPLDLRGRAIRGRRRKFVCDSVFHLDDPRRGAGEVQRAGREGLHDPPRLGNFAAGREPQRAVLVAEPGPGVVDG